MITSQRLQRTHQEIISNRFLRRHPSRILRRRLEHPIASARTNKVQMDRAQNAITPAVVAIIPCHSPAAARVLAQLQDRGNVPAAVAVVRRGPDSHDAAIEHLLVALHDELVGARDQGQVVFVVELPHDVAAKQEASAARAQAPAFDFVRIRPQQIAHGALVWHFLFSVDEPDLVYTVYHRGEAAMHAEDGARPAGTAGWSVPC